jgi:hypothetical protein
MVAMRFRAILFALLLAGGLLPIAAPAQRPTSLKAASLPFDVGDARAVVLFFIASDCPISNRTLPEMLRVQHEFAARHVKFWFVYPNLTETPAAIREHEATYGIKEEALTDPQQQLARLTGANVTPEAAILVPHTGIKDGSSSGLRTVYVGRLDDRYLSLGTERPAPTRHDLETSLAAVLDGRPVPAPGGPPIGCSIVNTK